METVIIPWMVVAHGYAVEFAEGVLAQQEGRPTNPYSKGTPKADAWLRGYESNQPNEESPGLFRQLLDQFQTACVSGDTTDIARDNLVAHEAYLRNRATLKRVLVDAQ